MNEALSKLARQSPQAAELVKLRIFVGLTVDEAAKVIGLTRSTAYRHWTYARAWLRAELADAAED